MRTLFWSLFVAVLGIHVVGRQPPHPRVVATGFTWAENLAFDGVGNMWVTDNVRGELWRIYRDGNSYSKQHWLSGFHRLLGMAVNPVPGAENNTHIG